MPGVNVRQKLGQLLVGDHAVNRIDVGRLTVRDDHHIRNIAGLTNVAIDEPVDRLGHRLVELIPHDVKRNGLGQGPVVHDEVVCQGVGKGDGSKGIQRGAHRPDPLHSILCIPVVVEIPGPPGRCGERSLVQGNRSILGLKGPDHVGGGRVVGMLDTADADGQRLIKP